MNKQMSKIEEFVTSVASTQMSEDQLSLVLSSSSNVIGGSNGSGQCTNFEVYACGGANKRCTNYGVCGTSDNRRNCTNKPKPFPTQTELGL